MSRAERLGLVVIVCLLAYAVAYQWQPPGPLYLPLERRWSWSPEPGALTMKWYARNLSSTGAMVLAGGLAWLYSGRCQQAWSQRQTLLATNLTIGALLALLLRLILTDLVPWASRAVG